MLAVALVAGAVLATLALAASGDIRTVAGNGTPGFAGDNGPATSAEISGPRGVSALPNGSYLIADSDNDRIRRVGTDGKITTVAGKDNPTNQFGGDGGPATAAFLNGPRGVEPLPGGGFLIADSFNNRVRRVGTDGKITTVAGTGSATSSGDGGQATSAGIGDPRDVSALPGGGFLIAQHFGCVVRRVDAAGKITTVAGVAPDPNVHCGTSGDNGPATSAQLGSLTNVWRSPAARS